jgi:hypothetical protein
MTNTHLHETAIALSADWDLKLPDTISEAEIIRLLAEKVGAIVSQGPEVFFQLMYRLDISEKKLNAAMHTDGVAEKIARLIYDRQMQKIQSRINNSSSMKSTDPDLDW